MSLRSWCSQTKTALGFWHLPQRAPIKPCAMLQCDSLNRVFRFGETREISRKTSLISVKIPTTHINLYNCCCWRLTLPCVRPVGGCACHAPNTHAMTESMGGCAYCVPGVYSGALRQAWPVLRKAWAGPGCKFTRSTGGLECVSRRAIKVDCKDASHNMVAQMSNPMHGTHLKACQFDQLIQTEWCSGQSCFQLHTTQFWNWFFFKETGAAMTRKKRSTVLIWQKIIHEKKGFMRLPCQQPARSTQQEAPVPPMC